MEEIEIWKDVVGYEGIYMVSNLGRIKALARFMKNATILPRILTPVLNKGGYTKFMFRDKNKKWKNILIHRVVAMAFIPNPENKKTVNHIDSVRNNNKVSNLEWATQSENMKHAFKFGHKKRSVEQMAYMAKWFKENKSVKVSQFDKEGNFIATYNQQIEAARILGLDATTICKCVRGVKKTCGGFIFKRA